MMVFFQSGVVGVLVVSALFVCVGLFVWVLLSVSTATEKEQLKQRREWMWLDNRVQAREGERDQVRALEKGEGEKEQQREVSRRRFLMLVGWGGVCASLGGVAWGSYRYVFPQFLYEPPAIFKIGRPTQFRIGVTETLKNKHQIWVVRNERGIYVPIAICRHLGCTPNWIEDQRTFRCPCHGSIFDLFGNVLGGPAPRTLWRAALSLTDDGEILVHFNKRQDPDVKATPEGGLFSVVPEEEREQPPFFIPFTA